ncbi:CxxH/CxxC protein [Sporosarcina sp. FSL K6-1522]|uniref:CxxH/CxxC protein n=1 Tax=Sporosarcina sp. FSL K6-1522 TaxID=2921554 RepID=UPI00315A6CCF
MKTYSCETHINHALDVFVAAEEKFPIMEAIAEDEKLSTNCAYCEQVALYIVSSEKTDTTCR